MKNMKFRYLVVPSLAITLLLTGCGQNDSDNSKDSKDKQEVKKKEKSKKSSKDSRDKDTNIEEASSNANNQQETQTEANINPQNGNTMNSDSMENATSQNTNIEEASSNANNQQEIQTETNTNPQNNNVTNSNSNNENINSKEYQDYLNAKQSQYALTHLTPEQKASGAGGGGAAWNYADEDESFADWKSRTDREKAEAGY